jgi:hypothetical protein
MPISSCLIGVLRFESLLVKAIKIAPLHTDQLRSYWKQVFFKSTSPILLLSSPVCRKEIANGKSTLGIQWELISQYNTLKKSCENAQ